MERPALKRLLDDVAAQKVDVVVVYKVDRLTRSLADFAKIVDIFDARKVSFVSVTQQFNTTSSMGRLTLNVLLSFAQFEREVTGERIRDKISASKRKGMWMGGRVPLGYDLQDRKLVPNAAEAALVNRIYSRYLELGCVVKLKAELDAAGASSKVRMSRTGRRSGGAPYSRGALYKILQNRIYVGEIPHRALAYPGEHPPIVERDTVGRGPGQAPREQSGAAERCHRARPEPPGRPPLRRAWQPFDAVTRGQERKALSVLCLAGADPGSTRSQRCGDALAGARH